MKKKTTKLNAKEKMQELERVTRIKHRLLADYLGVEKPIDLNGQPTFGLYEHTESEFYNDCLDIGKGIDTGFKGLNDKLAGGMPAGLCFIGGGSGVGKTAIAQQIALYMAENALDYGGYTGQAQNNRYIIFVSLEMGLASLTARFLARMYTQINPPPPYKEISVKDILGLEYLILDENPEINQAITAKITECKRMLKRYGERLILINSTFGVMVEDIEELYTHYKAMSDKQGLPPPVLIIDYLQAIAPSFENTTDKQNIDHTIRKLKIMQDRNNALVIALSSLNRASYNEPISKSSFKESGGIEYTADTLIGLELFIDRESLKENSRKLEMTQEDLFNARTRFIMESPNPRPIALRVLKNRLGTEASLYFTFSGKSMSFKEATKEEITPLATQYDFLREKEPQFKDTNPASKKGKKGKPPAPVNFGGLTLSHARP